MLISIVFTAEICVFSRILKNWKIIKFPHFIILTSFFILYSLLKFIESPIGQRFVVYSDEEESPNVAPPQYTSTTNGAQSGYPMYSQQQQAPQQPVNGYNAPMTSNGFDDDIDFDIGDENAIDYHAENRRVAQTLVERQRTVLNLKKMKQEEEDNKFARISRLKKPNDGSYVWNYVYDENNLSSWKVWCIWCFVGL